MAFHLTYEEKMILLPCWKEAIDPANWQNHNELRKVIALKGIDNPEGLTARIDRPRTYLPPDSVVSGPGVLSSLPLELVYHVISFMDLASAEYFSQTCRMSRYLLEHHVFYSVIARFVPRLRAIYALCGLKGWNTLYGLAEELHYPYCRTCGRQGTSLFLPLGERVCYNCSTQNPAFWCLSVSDAMNAFCMCQSQVESLPLVKSRMTVFSTANFPEVIADDESVLVPAKAAFLAALKIWGSRENMMRYSKPGDPDVYADSTLDEVLVGASFRFLRNMQLKTADDPSQLDGPVIYMHPRMSSLVTVPFPWVPRDKDDCEHRYMCRGCDWLSKQCYIGPNLLEYSGIDSRLPKARLDRIILGRRDIAHTWEELKEHIATCAGAGVLLRMYILERDHEDGMGSSLFW
ncbi:uncharacterized protein N7482_009895 [Penicillium canariense]|uniref:F-box domain-containing protein n=1 Tax=Penicillium canariense TaxID=189055 RepID=A0A9W9HQR8_9EURO|nr:uncharacterized protein N7482_009895 [Penicillium canariense]KAJ5153417.1 hypothetical protein N7482_009895 [Penicillium canariense]